MLETDGVELRCIQETGRADVIIDTIVVDLKANGGWIIVGVAMVCHRHDAGLQVRRRGCDRLLQIGGKGGNPAAAWKRIADERQAA
jgi:hypothetical protein